jgi:hypothetical protein
MIESKEMQKLHQSAIAGASLTSEEQTLLQNWYQELDRDEDLILNDSPPAEDLKDLRRNLTEITDQTARVSLEIKTLVTQNERLRGENQALRKSLEARLAEKAA